MKNAFKHIIFIALVAVMGLAFAAPVHSGGIVDRVFNGGAKSLAKQSVNLIKQAAALQEKALGIEEKALALSDKDRRTYQAELERLGFQPPEWLFNDAQALLTGAPPAPEGPGGILGFLAGIFGGGNRNSGGSSAPHTETATAPPAATPATTPATTTSGSGGTFTLTGIPSQYNGKYAMLGAENASRTIVLFGAQTITVQGGDVNSLIFTLTPIRSGRAVLNINQAVAGQAGRVIPYTGNDTLAVEVHIYNQASVGWNDNPAEEVLVTFTNISFRNGSAERAWSAGSVEEGPPPGAQGTFTLTGIPSQYNGKHASLKVVVGWDVKVVGAQTVTMSDAGPSVTFPPIRSGSAVFNLYTVTGNMPPYTGNDTFMVEVNIHNQASVGSDDVLDDVEVSITFENVTFRNGDATRAWGVGKVQ